MSDLINRIEIVDRENIYLENNPQYIVLFYKNKAYVMIIERFGYKDFNYYYHGESIPDEKTQKEIERYLYDTFLDYEKWNQLKINNRKVI